MQALRDGAEAAAGKIDGDGAPGERQSESLTVISVDTQCD
jgi:hypothetical protein